MGKEKVTPNAAESVRFWEDIWGSSVSHKKNAVWLKEVKKRIEIDKQEDLKIDVNMIRKRSIRMANWKTPGMDGV